MARVLGIGCLEANASKDMIGCCTHVEFGGNDDFQGRVDAVRALRSEDQVAFWEILDMQETSLLDPDLPVSFKDIVLKEQAASASDPGDYDRVSGHGARNFTMKYVTYSLALPGDRPGSKPRKPSDRDMAQIQTNLKFLIERFGGERLLIRLPSLPEDPHHREWLASFLEGSFLISILPDRGPGLAIDLDRAAEWAVYRNIGPAELLKQLPLGRLALLQLSGEHFTLLSDLFVEDRLPFLQAITYSGKDRSGLQRLKERLRAAGATLIEDALSVEYYFPGFGQFKHGEVFAGARYCYQVLKNIPAYTASWLDKRMAGLKPLLAGVSGMDRLEHPGATASIEKGACVHRSARIGPGVLIRAGAVVSADACIEGGAVVGDEVYIAEGARVYGAKLENQVYVGRGVCIEGNCVIRNRVWIDDGVELVRNSVIENSCCLGKGTVVDSAFIGNGVIIEEDCQLRPGTYIRKDTIFGRGVVFRSEAKNTVIMDAALCRDPDSGQSVLAGSESGHYGYCGDSILGSMVNEGAGDMNSNVKNDWGEVRVTLDGWKFASGLSKFGAVIGDYTSIGCLTVLEPGTMIGRACNVYGAKVRSWLQTATVFAEDQCPRPRIAGALPRLDRSLEGRSEPVRRTILEAERAGAKRIHP